MVLRLCLIWIIDLFILFLLKICPITTTEYYLLNTRLSQSFCSLLLGTWFLIYVLHNNFGDHVLHGNNHLLRRSRIWPVLCTLLRGDHMRGMVHYRIHNEICILPQQSRIHQKYHELDRLVCNYALFCCSWSFSARQNYCHPPSCSIDTCISNIQTITSFIWTANIRVHSPI